MSNQHELDRKSLGGAHMTGLLYFKTIVLGYSIDISSSRSNLLIDTYRNTIMDSFFNFSHIPGPAKFGNCDCHDE
jgi:hypothetical protein